MCFILCCYLNHNLMEVMFTARSKLRKVLFLVLSVPFCLFLLFVNQISREWLNGFVPNSQGRRVWSLTRTSLNVTVRGQRSRSPGTKTCCALLSPSGSERMVRSAAWRIVTLSSRWDHSIAARGDFGGLHAVCVVSKLLCSQLQMCFLSQNYAFSGGVSCSECPQCCSLFLCTNPCTAFNS